MKKTRIIARIDVKNEFAIKGIHLEGLRKIGDPNQLAKKYYDGGIDEIIFMDSVASYYNRNSLSSVIERACENIFIPITVGGGIRTIEDIQKALNSGADKVAINTAAVKNESFIKESSQIFGSQCIVISIEALKTENEKWEVFIDNGREPTGLDVIEWAKTVEELGAGEIMLTSIDQEGTKKGFDLELNKKVSDIISIPVISSGGAGKALDILDLLEYTDVDAVAIASILHYKLCDIDYLKKYLNNNKKINVRL